MGQAHVSALLAIYVCVYSTLIYVISFWKQLIIPNKVSWRMRLTAHTQNHIRCSLQLHLYLNLQENIFFFMYNRTTTWGSTAQSTESICLIWRPRLTTRRCKLDWSSSKRSLMHSLSLMAQWYRTWQKANRTNLSFDGSWIESLEIMEIMETSVSFIPDISLARHQRIGQQR